MSSQKFGGYVTIILRLFLEIIVSSLPHKLYSLKLGSQIFSNLLETPPDQLRPLHNALFAKKLLFRILINLRRKGFQAFACISLRPFYMTIKVKNIQALDNGFIRSSLR